MRYSNLGEIFYYSVIDNTGKDITATISTEPRIADIERAAAPCEVCRKLHEDELREESVDMFDWWVGQADCTELISYDRDILKDLDDEEDYIDEYDYEQESFKWKYFCLMKYLFERTSSFPKGNVWEFC